MVRRQFSGSCNRALVCTWSSIELHGYSGRAHLLGCQIVLAKNERVQSVARCGYDVLQSVELVRNRTVAHDTAQSSVPQDRSGSSVKGNQVRSRVAGEEQVASRG